jgi:hypothetical protein
MIDNYSQNCGFIDKGLVRLLEGVEIGSRVHEVDDVEAEEIEELESGSILICFGFSINQIIQALLLADKVLVVEPDLVRFKKVLTNRNLTSILTSQKLNLSVGEPVEEVKKRLRSLITPERIYKVRFVHGGGSGSFQDYFSRIREATYQLIQEIQFNLSTSFRFSRTWLRNLIQNLPIVVKAPPVEYLFGKFRGIPAVLISAGPSLDKNVAELHRLNDRALLISVDTALRTLLFHNVEPHLTICVDADEENYKNIEGLSVERSVLVADVTVFPKTFSEFKQGVLITSLSCSFFDWVRHYIDYPSINLDSVPRLKTGGSVASVAFDLARRAGCSPIIFVGQDLSFPQGVTYTRGFLSNDGLGGSPLDDLNKFKTLEMAHREWIRDQGDLIETFDLNGDKVFTSRRLLAYKEWLEREIETTPTMCINATEGGILKRGLVCMNLEDVILEYLEKKQDIDTVLGEIHAIHPKVDFAGLRLGLRNVCDEFRLVQSLCERAISVIKKGNGSDLLKGINIELEGVNVVKYLSETLERSIWEVLHTGGGRDIKVFYQELLHVSKDSIELLTQAIKEI